MNELKRKPIIDFNKIKSLLKDTKIQGNIIFSKFTENETLYIITDSAYFYFKEKDNEIKEKMFILRFSKNDDKYQTKENRPHLWCDEYCFHTLIYFDKRLYYFNPTFKDNPIEIEIVNKAIQNGKYLEPYSITFCENLNNELDKENFEILLSDYFSDIY